MTKTLIGTNCAPFCARSLFVLAACVFAAAPAHADTGSFCANNRVVSWYCGSQLQGSGWIAQGGGCYHKTTSRLCASSISANPVFDPTLYSQVNGDVTGNPRTHWLNYGQDECRYSTEAFSVVEYLQRNPDVAAAVGGSCRAALQHYATAGLHEGRIPLLDPYLREGTFPVFSNSTNPVGTDYGFTVWRLGNHAANVLDTHLDTSVITGLPNAYRASGLIIGPAQEPVDSVTGFTGVQQIGGEFGIGIDSRTVKALAQANGTSGLYTIVLQRDLSLRPWPFAGLRTALRLRIPFAGGQGGGSSQIVSYYLVRDTTTNKQFWLGVLVFDVRSWMFSNAINVFVDNCSDCTQLPAVTIPLRANSPYVRLASSSSAGTSSVHAESRTYDFTIDNANMNAIIDKLNAQGGGFSTNPSHYTVTAFVLNPEAFATGTQNGWIGFSGKVLVAGR